MMELARGSGLIGAADASVRAVVCQLKDDLEGGIGAQSIILEGIAAKFRQIELLQLQISHLPAVLSAIKCCNNI